MGFVEVILMRGVQGPVRTPRTIFTFNSPETVNQFATGCDGDSGGLSTVHFDYDTRPEVNLPLRQSGSGMFWGDMQLRVKPGMEGKVRGGWAGFRNKVVLSSAVHVI
jgi:NADH dehydrogenase [ubiquinone] 1 alpha subcomplex assembly factor 1